MARRVRKASRRRDRRRGDVEIVAGARDDEAVPRRAVGHRPLATLGADRHRQRTDQEQLQLEDEQLHGLPLYPEAVHRSPLLRDLLGFAASEAYYQARVKLVPPR